MPGMVLRTNRAVAISAPVLPADTAACALPSLTWLMAMRMDDSFLFFSADCGASSISTTCAAWQTVMRSIGAPAELNAWRTAASSPTIIRCTSDCCFRKSTAPGTVIARPASPPMASTASVIMLFSGLCVSDGIKQSEKHTHPIFRRLNGKSDEKACCDGRTRFIGFARPICCVRRCPARPKDS